MVKKKVCKKCKVFVEGDKCPNCNESSFTTNWQGRMNILDPVQSEIAKRVNIAQKGEYVIKCR